MKLLNENALQQIAVVKKSKQGLKNLKNLFWKIFLAYLTIHEKIKGLHFYLQNYVIYLKKIGLGNPQYHCSNLHWCPGLLVLWKYLVCVLYTSSYLGKYDNYVCFASVCTSFPSFFWPAATNIHPHPHTGVPGAVADDSARLPGGRLHLPLHRCRGLH